MPDKRPYIRYARQVYALLSGLPHRPGDRVALALHTARQIVSFYEHYSLPQPPASDSLVYRDAHAAQNLRWWQQFTGSKVVYWAASAHTANAPRLKIAVPPGPDWFERPFGRTGLGQFALDLRTPAPPPIRRWLHSPIKIRGFPDRGPGSYLAGGTLAQWFDVIIHRQELTPAQPA